MAPRGYAVTGVCQAQCAVVKLQGPNGIASIYGRPTSDPADIIGQAKAGAIFVSTMSVTEDAPPPLPPPTSTPTPTPTATTTDTPTPIATDTPTATVTDTPTPTPTQAATDTHTPTSTADSASVAPLAQVTTSTGVVWYEINYNHRQAWVPASEVQFV